MNLAKASRIITSSDRATITVEEVNQLFIRAGYPSRSLSRLTLALDYSLACISARLLQEKTLVGFARLGGDGVFQATIWDLLVDPTLPQPEATKHLILERLKREVKQQFPKCCISIFSLVSDQKLLYNLGFKEDEKGIKAMQFPVSTQDFG